MPETTMTATLEQGSFRDRDGRVFYGPDGVYRGLSVQALAEWERLSSKKFYARFTEAGKLVGTERVDDATAARILPAAENAESWAAVLKHETIPFISYPYEWCFGMLKDAALLQLELTGAALAADMTLKDATPYNVQWRGASPVFIDLPSFVQLEPGEPWAGYRQFCELFLYPLFLQAYKDVSYHAWLRGSIDGIPASECWGLMSARDVLRSGVLLHVGLAAKMQAAFSKTEKDVKKQLKDAGFNKELIQVNVRKLTKLVSKLTWKASGSEWSDYATHNTYDAANRARKEAFVRHASSTGTRNLVWDLGCNTGDYSRIAAETAPYVVAMDGDHLAIERLYRALREEGNTRILPLVGNIADASPNLGWRGAERKSLDRRGTPDLILALALIHHIVIGANIPLSEFIDWLATLDSDLVIEFVNKDDSMVKTLLRNKEDRYTDYEQPFFEECLTRHFDIAKRETLDGETRTLYFATRRS
jgi:SAM-dependent methyltransferase